MGSHRKSERIESSNFCCYGCGNIAKFRSPGGKELCSERWTQCPVNRKKNSIAVQKRYDSNERKSQKIVYQSLPEDVKSRMAWSRGLSKDVCASLARPDQIGKRFGCSLTGFTDDIRQKMSISRKEYLKKSENRKNIGRHQRSWMEINFENYLSENGIDGWESEKHFWSVELKKNFYPDFIFESKKLIIELDGTQHRKTIEKDRIRDDWFLSIGYRVVRIPVEEFKKRLFSGSGFLDILGV